MGARARVAVPGVGHKPEKESLKGNHRGHFEGAMAMSHSLPMKLRLK